VSDRHYPLKIIQISTNDQGGGAEGSAWNLFREYQKRGHKSWLLVGSKRTTHPDIYEIPRLARPDPFNELTDVNLNKNDLVLGVILRASLFLARKRRDAHLLIAKHMGWENFNFPGSHNILKLVPDKPDVIHAHNLHGGYFDLRLLAKLSHQFPLILNLRDMWLLTGHCSYSLGCNRWKYGCGKCPDLSIYPAIRRDATKFNWQRKSNIYEKSHLYIATPSEWLMDQVQDSMLNGVEYRVIPNSVDQNTFRPGDKFKARKLLGLPSNEKIILFTAHSRFKDQNTVEEALTLLRKTKGSKMLFICLGTQAEEKYLGNGRMIFPGFVRDRSRLTLYYQASDIFIHAAKNEVFGKTIIEAMSCGTPVVATAVGGIPEIIEDGKTGLLVPSENAQAIAADICRVLTNPDLRSRLSRAGIKEVKDRFSLRKQVDDFLAWYEEVIEDWNRWVKQN
jgi:glycosyltransferase involved in cell wall biosynthesis